MQRKLHISVRGLMEKQEKLLEHWLIKANYPSWMDNIYKTLFV